MFNIIKQFVKNLSFSGDIYSQVLKLNKEAGGGKPTLITVDYGNLDIPSKSLIIGDIMYPETLLVENLTSRASISLQVLKYPKSIEKVVSVNLMFDPNVIPDHANQIGEIPVDSAKIITVDQGYFGSDWLQEGPERIGMISVLSNEHAAKLIAKKFKVKIEPYRFAAYRIKGDVSEKLEHDIIEYLETIPEFKGRTFFAFRIETNNSFDRLCFREEAYHFAPVGLNPQHQLFFTSTGHGDGCYPLMAHYHQSKIVSLDITFINQEDIQEIFN